MAPGFGFLEGLFGIAGEGGLFPSSYVATGGTFCDSSQLFTIKGASVAVSDFLFIFDSHHYDVAA